MESACLGEIAYALQLGAGSDGFRTPSESAGDSNFDLRRLGPHACGHAHLGQSPFILLAERDWERRRQFRRPSKVIRHAPHGCHRRRAGIGNALPSSESRQCAVTRKRRPCDSGRKREQRTAYHRSNQSLRLGHGVTRSPDGARVLTDIPTLARPRRKCRKTSPEKPA